MRQVVLDTETTGFDFQRDRLVELGCVELQDLIPTGNTFHAYINPGIAVPQEATDVHGLTNAFLDGQPAFAAVAAHLAAFLADSPIIAHNAAFDVGFLSTGYLAAGHDAPSNEIIDTLALARAKHPGSPCSLEALCRRYNIKTTHRTKHGALIDALLLAEVYVDLVGRQSAMDLASVREQTAPIAIPVRPAPLSSRITTAEIAAHAAMVAALPNSLWR